MKTKIRLPMLFDANVRGHKSQKTVYLAREHSVDIPDVAGSDTNVVFSANTGVLGEVNPYQERSPLTFYNGSGKFELREYEGRIYRPVDDYFADAFPFHSHMACVSRPIRHHYDFLLSMIGVPRKVMTWPSYDLYQEAREVTLFDDLLDQFVDMDNKAFREAEDMHAKRIDELLVVDGQMWVVTTPPCFSVEVRQGYHQQHEDKILYSLGLAPDSFDPCVGRRYFPITDQSAAQAHIEALRGLLPPGKTSFGEKVPNFAFDAHAAFDFDPTEEISKRLPVALALSSVLEKKKALAAPEIAEEAFARIKAQNMVLGSIVDLSDMFDGLVEAWDSVERPGGKFLSFGAYRGVSLRNALFNATIEEIESRTSIRLDGLIDGYGISGARR